MKNLEHALAHAHAGRPVFPLHYPLQNGCSCNAGRSCTNIGKHPIESGWQESATTDEAQIRKWWRKTPRANIGMPTGEKSGLDVLDIDPRHGGDDTLFSLEKKYGKLPDSIESITGGGGRQVFFRANAAVRPSVGESNALGHGLDVRASGGLVVLPGSLHASGRHYAWEASGDPDEGAVAADWPEWLVTLLTKERNGRGSVSKTPDRWMGGGRNSGLTSEAGAMRQRGFNGSEILPALLALNENRCEPALDREEVEKIAFGMERYEPKPSRVLKVISSPELVEKEQVPCYLHLTQDGKSLRSKFGDPQKIFYALAKQHRAQNHSQRMALLDLQAIQQQHLGDMDPRTLSEIVARAFVSQELSWGCEILQEHGLCPAAEGNACHVWDRRQALETENNELWRNKFNDGWEFGIEPLSVLETDDPIYTATVQGQSIELSLQELREWKSFVTACVSKLRYLPVIPYTEDKKGRKIPDQKLWELYVREALKSVVVEPAPPEDATPSGLVWCEIRRYLCDGRLSEDRDDVLTGSVVITELNGRDVYLFRGDCLMARLRTFRLDTYLTPGQVWKLIRRKGGENGPVYIPNLEKEVRCWYVPVSVFYERLTNVNECELT